LIKIAVCLDRHPAIVGGRDLPASRRRMAQTPTLEHLSGGRVKHGRRDSGGPAGQRQRRTGADRARVEAGGQPAGAATI